MILCFLKIFDYSEELYLLSSYHELWPNDSVFGERGKQNRNEAKHQQTQGFQSDWSSQSLRLY